MPAKTVMIILPAGVVVSAHGSEIDLNLAPALANNSVVSSKVLVERANDRASRPQPYRLHEPDQAFFQIPAGGCTHPRSSS
jgi:hypothetical protein